MTSTFGERLKLARTSKKLTQKELAHKIGAKHNSISDWENNKNKPDPDAIELLCGVLEISPNYLLGSNSNDTFKPKEIELIKKYRDLDDHGKEMVDSAINIEWKRVQRELEQPKGEIIELDFSSYKASAGTGYLLLDDATEQISVYSNPTTRKADICIAVSGNSMMPKFHDGDILLVRKQPDVLQGEIGIFLRGDEAFVKKKGTDHLISLNPDYPNISDDGDNLITCYGKVIHKLEEEWIVK